MPDESPSDFRIIEWDEYNGVPYILIERWYDLPELPSFSPEARVPRPHPMSGYYCGYLKGTRTNWVPEQGEVIEGTEITYGPDSLYWFGFDTAHYGQEHTTEDDARAKLKELIDALR